MLTRPPSLTITKPAKGSLKNNAGLIFFRQAMKTFVILFSLLLSIATVWSEDAKPPVHLAIVGLVHDHAYGFIPLTRGRPEVQLVGIVEPDQEVAATFAKRFDLNSNLFYTSLEALLAKTNVDAVAAFTTTLDHRRVVEMCAPLHIDVMMEKPLAVNMQEARAIQAAAKSGGIEVIVNYETTWYRANQTAYKLVDQEHAIGDLRKIVAHDGHRGPKEIGCSETFLNWLTDPKFNGGGALPDFGCYGADLITWLMAGQRPTSVFAVTQQIKPDIYPKVEDEATVVLTYPKAQGIIQASWNWPIDRKDLEIYGTTGYVLAPRKDLLRIRKVGTQESELDLPAPPPSRPQDQLSYLVSVVRGETQPSGLSCLDINLTVTEILDAARESARTGRRIDLPAAPAQ
jgi:predicted dehydrogenase